MKAYTGRRRAKAGLEVYRHFYKTQMRRQALGYRTPAEVFNGDSVSGQRSEKRRLPPSRALAGLVKKVGLPLKNAPILSN